MRPAVAGGQRPRLPTATRRWQTATSYYNAPALDGSRPGIYYINLRDTAEWPRLQLPTLTYHEAVPGHHHQIALAQERANTPLLMKVLGFSA